MQKVKLSEAQKKVIETLRGGVPIFSRFRLRRD